VETAELAFAGTGIAIRQDPRLRECNYGTLNGMPVSDLAQIRSRHIAQPFPGGQSYQEVVDQTRDFLSEVARPGRLHRPDQLICLVLFALFGALTGWSQAS